jgi:outer membrane receptor protein involved in Fe transport
MKRVFAIVLLGSPMVAVAQRDTSARPLDAVIVTAERTRSVLGSATSSISTISVADLANTPHATVADALRRVPGFALVDFDGIGFDPQLMVRGFYGGGEAEYVVMLVDGRPVAQVQNGLVPWAALPPLSAIQSIEVVRGSSSALYGDAAIGGIINIITRRGTAGTPLRFDLSGGSFDGLAAGASLAGSGGRLLWGGVDRTDGYRDHAKRSTIRGGASVPIATGSSSITATVGGFHQAFDEPGPQNATPVEEDVPPEDRRSSDPLYRFDHTSDTRIDVGLRGERRNLSGYVGGEWRSTDAIRTIVPLPEFGDTKERLTDNRRLTGSVQLDFNRLVVGGDVGYSTMGSRYHGVAAGSRAQHVGMPGGRGALESRGDAARINGAVFAQYTMQPVPRVRFSLGARFDALSDDFEPRSPSEGSKLSASHTAFSPKAGVNVRYLETARTSGSFYVTASGSFKAPTLDQLFDQRTTALPFSPFALSTSNALLNPQRGGNIEAGLYHATAFGSSVTGALSASVYQMDMRDEIDFSFETLGYVNIGKSRHRGIEAGLSVSAPGNGSVFANYTLQKATFRAGDNEGKQLKAIPKHTISAGGTIDVMKSLQAGVTVSRASDAFMDDANSSKLAAYTRVDATLSYALRGSSIFVEARNLFDREYSTTGFLLPAGRTSIAYVYPAAGRIITAGVRRGW